MCSIATVGELSMIAAIDTELRLVATPPTNMIESSVLLTSLAKSVQPLVFETGVESYPYSSAGTVFLVGFKGKAYVVTTRHGLNPENPPAICVFPTDTSHRFLPLGNVFFVPRDYEPDDFMDLAVIDILPSAKGHPELGQATLIDLAKAFEPDWEKVAEQMELVVLGFPSEHLEINADTQELRTERIALSGKHAGKSMMDYLHIFQVNDPQQLGTYSGFSGGPVFGLQATSHNNFKPVFCGMAVRGTPQSGVIHFLDASVILDALQVKAQRDSHPAI